MTCDLPYMFNRFALNYIDFNIREMLVIKIGMNAEPILHLVVILDSVLIHMEVTSKSICMERFQYFHHIETRILVVCMAQMS